MSDLPLVFRHRAEPDNDAGRWDLFHNQTRVGFVRPSNTNGRYYFAVLPNEELGTEQFDSRSRWHSYEEVASAKAMLRAEVRGQINKRSTT